MIVPATPNPPETVSAPEVVVVLALVPLMITPVNVGVREVLMVLDVGLTFVIKMLLPDVYTTLDTGFPEEYNVVA